jgi:hypothetical protein
MLNSLLDLLPGLLLELYLQTAVLVPDSVSKRVELYRTLSPELCKVDDTADMIFEAHWLWAGEIEHVEVANTARLRQVPPTHKLRRGRSGRHSHMLEEHGDLQAFIVQILVTSASVASE